jgi:RNA recognition motif-containing protein
MKRQIERPITDIVGTENLTGSSTQAATLFASSARSFPSCVRSRLSTVSISEGGTPMGSKLYVGGLPYAATESQLTTLFAAHGTVESARVITDKFTGQSRGFGFVEMATQEEAKAAITALNGSQMDGRPLTVNEAKPQEPRTGGGGGRFGGGGGDRGGRGRF